MKELRSDFTNSLVHLTRERTGSPCQENPSDNDQEYSALDVLCEILNSGKY